MNDSEPYEESSTEERVAYEQFAAKKDEYLRNALEQANASRVDFPELAHTLEEIDFTQLKGLFLERIERTDPYDRDYLREHMAFASSDRIVPVAASGGVHESGANAHIDKVLITITTPSAPPPLPEGMVSSVLAPEILLEQQERAKAEQMLRLFHTVVHEETHIVASEIPDEVYEVGANTGYRTGFENGVGGGVNFDGEVIPVRSILYRSFNEGVTEKIAREVSGEYLRRYGVGELRANDWESYQPSVYEKECLLVDALTELVAVNTGVPALVVWDAITEAYFTGRQNGMRAIASAYPETEQDGLLDRLRHLSGSGYPVLSLTVDQELRGLVEAGKLSSELAAKIEKAVPKFPTLPPLPTE